MTDATTSTLEEIVKLNIGGTRYTTTMGTLTKRGASNFFSSLLSGRHAVRRDEKGAVWVDREGSYFGVILEYLRTGELFVPPTVPLIGVRREAEFYGIEIPTLAESVERASLSYIDDAWLQRRYLLASVDAHRPLVDAVVDVVLARFRWCAEHRVWPPEATFRGEFDEPGLALTLERNGVRPDAVAQIVGVCRHKYAERAGDDAAVCTDVALFTCLNQHRVLISAYCKHHGLTVDVSDAQHGHNSLQFDYATLRIGFPPLEQRDVINVVSHGGTTRTRPAWPELVVRGPIGVGALT
jgi:hypothetical protein